MCFVMYCVMCFVMCCVMRFLIRLLMPLISSIMLQALFGSIDIPFDLDPPKELNLGRIPTLAHATSAESVIIKDIKTVEIKKLRYDGSAPGTNS